MIRKLKEELINLILDFYAGIKGWRMNILIKVRVESPASS